MLKTTHSIPRGNTVRKASALVWSPLQGKSDIRCEENKDPALDQTRDAAKRPEINFTTRSFSPSALRVRVLRVPIERFLVSSQIMPAETTLRYSPFGYITSNLQSPIDLLDNHFDGVDSHGKLFAFGDGVGHSATAVGHLGV